MTASGTGADNRDEDILRRYKRAFLSNGASSIATKRRCSNAPTICSIPRKESPTLVSGEALRAGLQQTTTRPFRVAPFFDPGIWGGQWMKQQFDLDPAAPNYAWCFDCVPEENSLLLRFGQVRIEIPSQNLVLLHPRALLGEKVHARFGAEFPIRFDFLDTIGGQNLSFRFIPSPSTSSSSLVCTIPG